jgi:ribosomal protein S4E
MITMVATFVTGNDKWRVLLESDGTYTLSNITTKAALPKLTKEDIKALSGLGTFLK